MQNKIKTRIFPESNYRSVFINGKTIRQAIDPKKQVTELKFAEFLDISFGSKCQTGQSINGGCYYCYAAASKTGVYYTNLVEKINKFFGGMTQNQLPYQVAIGGGSEALENPECWDAFKAFKNLGIQPNVTTNGVLINDKTIEKLKESVDCVAVTMHPHLKKYWENAIKLLSEAGFKLNVHAIVSDKESIDNITECYYKYARNNDKVDYFVLLPYVNVGHAAKFPKKINIPYFTKFVDDVHEEGKLAFGANFYNFLLKNSKKYKVETHPPEIFSKYLCLDDNLSTYNNSFNMNPVKFIPGEGFELGKARMDFTENYLEE